MSSIFAPTKEDYKKVFVNLERIGVSPDCSSNCGCNCNCGRPSHTNKCNDCDLTDIDSMWKI